MKKYPIIAAVILSAATAFGHVAVRPTQSKKSATETYTLRVPSEGGKTTAGLILTVPAGVTIVSVGIPKDGAAVAYSRKSAAGAEEVTWNIAIKPGEVAELIFTAVNGSEGDAVAWKVQQKYSDGSSQNYAPTTALEAGAAPTKAP